MGSSYRPKIVRDGTFCSAHFFLRWSASQQWGAVSAPKSVPLVTILDANAFNLTFAPEPNIVSGGTPRKCVGRKARTSEHRQVPSFALLERVVEARGMSGPINAKGGSSYSVALREGGGPSESGSGSEVKKWPPRGRPKETDCIERVYFSVSATGASGLVSIRAVAASVISR